MLHVGFSVDLHILQDSLNLLLPGKKPELFGWPSDYILITNLTTYIWMNNWSVGGPVNTDITALVTWLRFRFSETMQHWEFPAWAAVYPQVQPFLLSHGQVGLGWGGRQQLRGHWALSLCQGLLACCLYVHTLQIIKTPCCLIHDLCTAWTWGNRTHRY